MKKSNLVNPHDLATLAKRVPSQGNQGPSGLPPQRGVGPRPPLTLPKSPPGSQLHAPVMAPSKGATAAQAPGAPFPGAATQDYLRAPIMPASPPQTRQHPQRPQNFAIEGARTKAKAQSILQVSAARRAAVQEKMALEKGLKLDYTPVNIEVYVTAFDGAMTGFLGGRSTSNPDPAAYAEQAAASGVWAQQFDILWDDATAINEAQAEIILVGSYGAWIGRSPSVLTPKQVTVAITALIAAITESDAWYESQGITPPPWNTGGGSTFEAAQDLSGTSLRQNVIGIQNVPVSAITKPINDGFALLSVGGEFVTQGVRPFVNVKNFGAVGDGVADDTAAIQAAIDYVCSQQTISFPTANTVYFPVGNYATSKPIFVWNAAIRITGESNQAPGGDLTVGTNIYSFGGSADAVCPVFVINANNSAPPTFEIIDGISTVYCPAGNNPNATFDALNVGLCLSEATTACNLNGLAALTFECFIQPSGVVPLDASYAINTIAGSTGASHDTGQYDVGQSTQALLFGYRNIAGANQLVCGLSTDVNPSGNYTPGAYLDNSGGTELPANALTHVAMTYDGTTLRMFVAGQLVNSTALTGTVDQKWYETFCAGGTGWTNGIYPANLSGFTLGWNSLAHYFGSMRVTNTCLYTESFTPPASELELVTGTLLLANFTTDNTTATYPQSYTWMRCQTNTLPFFEGSPFPVWTRFRGFSGDYIDGIEFDHLTLSSQVANMLVIAVNYSNFHDIAVSGGSGITFDCFSYEDSLYNFSSAPIPGSFPYTQLYPGYQSWGVAYLNGSQFMRISNGFFGNGYAGGNWAIVTAGFNSLHVENVQMYPGHMGYVYANGGNNLGEDLHMYNCFCYNELGSATIAGFWLVNLQNFVFEGAWAQLNANSTAPYVFVFDGITHGEIYAFLFNESIGGLADCLFLSPNPTPLILGGNFFSGYNTTPLVDTGNGVFGPVQGFGMESQVFTYNFTTGGPLSLPQFDFLYGTVIYTDTSNYLTTDTNVVFPTAIAAYTRKVINATSAPLTFGAATGSTVGVQPGGSAMIFADGTNWRYVVNPYFVPAQATISGETVDGDFYASGNQAVNITGTGFINGSEYLSFSLNGIPCTSVIWVSATECTIVTPLLTGVASPSSTFVLSGVNGDGYPMVSASVEVFWDPSQLEYLVTHYEAGIGVSTSGGQVTSWASAAGHEVAFTPAVAAGNSYILNPNVFDAQPGISINDTGYMDQASFTPSIPQPQSLSIVGSVTLPTGASNWIRAEGDYADVQILVAGSVYSIGLFALGTVISAPVSSGSDISNNCSGDFIFDGTSSAIYINSVSLGVVGTPGPGSNTSFWQLGNPDSLAQVVGAFTITSNHLTDTELGYIHTWRLMKFGVA